MPNRYTGNSEYDYGFQGQEMDDEVRNGKGNSINYTFRMHDPRVGRFFACDPLEFKYHWYTPYQFSGNKVIRFVELEGLEEGDPMHFDSWTDEGDQSSPAIQNVSDESMMKRNIAFTAVVTAPAAVFVYLNGASYLSSAMWWASNPANQTLIYEGGALTANLIYPGPEDIAPTPGPGGELGNLIEGTFRVVAKSDLVQKVLRPTWQASETYVGKLLGKSYKAQKSFVKGKEVKYGTKGSARPEYYNPLTKHSIEVKNYNIASAGNRSNLINNVANQANYRKYNLPEGSHQSVLIDVRGQEYTQEILDGIKGGILDKLEDGVSIDITFIE